MPGHECSARCVCYAIIIGYHPWYQLLPVSKMLRVATITHLGEVVVRYQGALPKAKHSKVVGAKASHCFLCYSSCSLVPLLPIAKASAAPPEMSPANDSRPQHWVEVAKSGDCWMLCKDGGWVAGIGACHVMGWPT